MISSIQPQDSRQYIQRIANLKLERDDKLQSISDLSAQVTGTKFASISLLTDEEVNFLCSTGHSRRTVKRRNSFCHYALLAEEPIFVIDDTENDPRFNTKKWVQKSGIKFYAGVPLASEGIVIGTLCVYDNHPRCLTKSDQGILIALANHVVDIIELKKQNKQLTQLSLVAKHSNSAVVITDNQGKIEYVNKAFEKLTHYTFQEVFGRRPGDLLQGPDTDPQHVQNISNALRNHLSTTQEILNYTKEGNPYWVSSSISPVFDDHGLRNFIAVQYDVTEQKAKEQELRDSKDEAQTSAKLKEQFLSNMSHEIRTPMNGVIGIANILLDDTTLSDKQREYINHIHYSASNLLTVINDILDFSKINSEKLTFEAVNFDLHQVFNALHNTIGFRAKEKGVAFELEIDPKMPKFVCGDPGRLNQILLNVVGNAIKFTELGSVTVDAKINMYTADGPQITVAVKDTGVGISKEKLDTVFEEFQQENSYVSRKFGGSGLGLTISKQLVEMYGGSIHLDSVEGEGTTVTFTIQLANPIVEISEKQHQIHRNRIEHVDHPNSNGERVLLVEDNIMNQIVAQSPIEKAGYELEVANNGLEALEKIKSHDFDLILMDVQMPVMNGLEATIKIRELKPDIPIIAMTASVMQHDLDRCFAVGMNESISKPINTKEMLSKISSLIKSAA
jgi:PAS domain S-box-containing protein